MRRVDFSWLAVALYLATALGVVITENTISINPVNLAIGDLHILPDVYYSIVNNALTSLTGSLNNQGAFYVTSANGLAASVSIVSGSIRNSGLLAFNSSRASVVSAYNLNSFGVFNNTGNMWFGISGFAIAPINLGSTTNWENSGRIHLTQARGSSSDVRITQTLGRVDNHGTVCLTNMNWIQSTSIEGSGCINVGDLARLQLQLDPWDVSSSQTIFLSSSNSLLSVAGLSTGFTGTKTYYVRGFGGGNQIRINLGFDSWSY